MADIVHRIGIKAPANQVYQALATLEGLARWWTEDASGDCALGGRIEFRFRSIAGEPIGAMTMEVVELEEGASVRWRCVDGPPEWIGTGITFDLSVQDGQTIILFGHRNWREVVEPTYHCSMKWAVFMLSLRDYVEKGKGQPAPHDIKIDNWN